MCDLFGLSCNAEDRATRSLPIFRDKGRSNRSGWGLGYYVGNRAIVERNSEDINSSERFLELIEEAQSNNIISHLRMATPGVDGTRNACEVNCHPFTDHYLDRDWIFAHNGVVEEALDHPHRNSEGGTDSEQVFRHMMDQVRDYLSTDKIRGTYPAVRKAIKKIFSTFKSHINFNMLLSDGNNMYVFSHHSDKTMYMLRRQKGYGGATLVSTRELTTNERWQKIPRDRLLVLSKGEVLVISNKII